jgi:DNA-binding response OmpR family regulator
MTKILLVEDDIALSKSLLKGLELKGYEVTCLFDGLDARMADWTNYDLVIMDWNLPKFSGVDVIRFKRRENWNGLVLMLTARSEALDVANGLDFGSDDYLAKPFEWEVLYAHIRALLRRKNTGKSIAQYKGPLVWVEDEKRFTEYGKDLNLTDTEYQLLLHFYLHSSKIITRDNLINTVYSRQIVPDSNVIDRHISSIRKKCTNDPIQTIRGSGYRLRSSPASA